MADSKYRVKLYSFGENLQWMDLGTGRVSLSYLERLQGLALVIRADTNGNHIIIYCIIVFIIIN